MASDGTTEAWVEIKVPSGEDATYAETLRVLGVTWASGLVSMLLIVAIGQALIYAIYQHEEFGTLLLFVVVPGSLAYAFLICFSELVTGRLHGRAKVWGAHTFASFGSFSVFLAIYYMTSERSFVARHDFVHYLRALMVTGIPYSLGVLLFYAFQKCLPSRFQLRQRKFASDRVWLCLLVVLFLFPLFLGLLPAVFAVGQGRSQWLLEETAVDLSLRLSPNLTVSDFFVNATGDWHLVDGKDGTLYTAFRLIPVPREHPECQKHIENSIVHPLGGDVRFCFAAIVTRGRSDLQFPEGVSGKNSDLEGTFVIVVSTVREDWLRGSKNLNARAQQFAHTLRFFPMLYNSTLYNWTEDFSQRMVEPADFAEKADKLQFHATRGIGDIFDFLYLEDFPLLIADLLHGALHSCYCFGFFGLDQHGQMAMIRYNRWSWDVLSSWTGRKLG